MPSCVLCIFCLYFINCCICLSVSHPNCTDHVGCGFECTSLVPFYIIPSYSTSVFTGTVTYNPPLHIFLIFRTYQTCKYPIDSYYRLQAEMVIFSYCCLQGTLSMISDFLYFLISNLFHMFYSISCPIPAITCLSLFSSTERYTLSKRISFKPSFSEQT